jgi:hypothetical protein
MLQRVLQLIVIWVTRVPALQANLNEILRRLADYGNQEMRRMKAAEEREHRVFEETRETLNSDFLAGVQLEGIN